MTKAIHAWLLSALSAPIALGCGSVAGDPTASDTGADPVDARAAVDTATVADTSTTADTTTLGDATVTADTTVVADLGPAETGARGVECGGDICFGGGDGCVICRPDEKSPARFCSKDFFAGECKALGFYPRLNMFCDGAEDCATGERCVLVERTDTFAECQGFDGGAGGSILVCRTLADCPPSSKTCEPYHPADGARAAYPVNVCRS